MRGLCDCGCGQRTRIATKTETRFGHVKGQPLRFVQSHHGRPRPRSPEHAANIAAALRGVPKSAEHRAAMSGPKHHSWRGGRYIDGEGYVRVLRRESPMAYADGYALEHRVVAAEQLGRPLLSTEIVHHVNGDKTDNRPENLRLFESVAAHIAFHAQASVAS